MQEVETEEAVLVIMELTLSSGAQGWIIPALSMLCEVAVVQALIWLSRNWRRRQARKEETDAPRFSTQRAVCRLGYKCNSWAPPQSTDSESLGKAWKFVFS